MYCYSYNKFNKKKETESKIDTKEGEEDTNTSSEVVANTIFAEVARGPSLLPWGKTGKKNLSDIWEQL